MWCDPFLDAAEVALDVLGSEAVAEAWTRPSSLDRMTVGQLAGHTARAVLTVNSYLDQPASGDPVDAVAYILTVSDDTDLASPLNKGVRDRATEEAAPGPAALVEATMAALTTLRLRLPDIPPETPLAVMGGIPIRLDEYIKTRLLELIVHLDDLAASLDKEPVPVAEAALESVAALLADVATARHGPWTVIRAFTRRERMISWPGVF